MTVHAMGSFLGLVLRHCKPFPALAASGWLVIPAPQKDQTFGLMQDSPAAGAGSGSLTLLNSDSRYDFPPTTTATSVCSDQRGLRAAGKTAQEGGGAAGAASVSAEVGAGEAARGAAGAAGGAGVAAGAAAMGTA